MEEFSKVTPSRMNVPRQPSPSDPKWGKVDLSESQDPNEQEKKYKKQVVSSDSA